MRLRGKLYLGSAVTFSFLVIAACGVPLSGHPPPSESSDDAAAYHPTGSTDSGGDTGATGSEGGVDSGLDSASAKVPYANCDTFDPTMVYGIGALKAGPNGNEVIVNVTTGAWCGPLPLNVQANFIFPNGKLIYIGYVGPHLRRFVLDPIYREGLAWTWSETPSPFENDTLLPDPCPSAMAPHHIGVWADTGDYVYSCFDSDPPHSLDGTKTYQYALSFGFAGHWLRDFTGFQIVDSAGVVTQVVGGPASTDKLAIRAKADGFLVAAGTADRSAVELWKITFDGTATKTGTYAARPAGIGGSFVYSVMDAAGNLYDTSTMGIGRRPLAPAAYSIVYGPTGDVAIPGSMLSGP